MVKRKTLVLLILCISTFTFCALGDSDVGYYYESAEGQEKPIFSSYKDYAFDSEESIENQRNLRYYGYSSYYSPSYYYYSGYSYYSYGYYYYTYYDYYYYGYYYGGAVSLAWSVIVFGIVLPIIICIAIVVTIICCASGRCRCCFNRRSHPPPSF